MFTIQWWLVNGRWTRQGRGLPRSSDGHERPVHGTSARKLDRRLLGSCGKTQAGPWTSPTAPHTSTAKSVALDECVHSSKPIRGVKGCESS